MVGVTEAWAIACVFVGCQACNVALEYIVADPFGKSFGVGLTFLQFAGVAFFSLGLNVTRAPVDQQPHWSVAGLRMKDRHLSWQLILMLSSLFWVSSVLNNVTFVFGVSVPINTMCRSSMIVVTMMIGYFVFGTRYSASQVLCGTIVTAGVMLLSYLTGGTKLRDVDAEFSRWLMGMVILLLSIVVSPIFNFIQDRVFNDARRQSAPGAKVTLWSETLMYNHLFSLPLFAAFLGPVTLFNMITSIPPALKPFVFIYMLGQFFCISSVYVIVENTSPLSLVITLTLRKSISILISLLIFGHYRTFTALHYLSVALIVGSISVYPFLSKPQQKSKSD